MVSYRVAGGLFLAYVASMLLLGNRMLLLLGSILRATLKTQPLVSALAIFLVNATSMFFLYLVFRYSIPVLHEVSLRRRRGRMRRIGEKTWSLLESHSVLVGTLIGVLVPVTMTLRLMAIGVIDAANYLRAVLFVMGLPHAWMEAVAIGMIMGAGLRKKPILLVTAMALIFAAALLETWLMIYLPVRR